MEEASLTLSQSNVAGGAHLIRVSGEVDLSTAPALGDSLAQFAEGDVHVDLSGVTFLDSSGLQALVRAHRAVELRGDQLIVHGASALVLRVMDVSGVDAVLHLDGQAPSSDS